MLYVSLAAVYFSYMMRIIRQNASTNGDELRFAKFRLLFAFAKVEQHIKADIRKRSSNSNQILR